MNNYEILYIIRCDIDDEQRSQVIGKYEALARELGTLVSMENWGMKKFAYEINKQTEGVYVLMNVECDSAAQAEIDRQMGIDDNVVRKMIIKK